MINLDLIEIDLVTKLVMSGGHVITTGQRCVRLRKGSIYLTPVVTNGWSDVYGKIPGSTLFKLYKHCQLFTRRVVKINDGTSYHYYTVWEIFRPALNQFECFKELTVQHSLGTI